MKNSLKAVAYLIAASLFFGLCSCESGKSGADVKNTESGVYGTGGIFDASFIHKIEVFIADDDWNDLKNDPLSKTKYETTVVIDGETLSGVSFATKGNTSLSMVASSDSDRYSFKLNFGKFRKGQTYKGIDKLNLNNIMSDATYMKDHLSYMIMREAGVKAPYSSYAELYINGSLHGLYIIIENVSGSFLESNYGDSSGALYKPEAKQALGADDRQPEGNVVRRDRQAPGGAVPQAPGMGTAAYNHGTDLVYTDDNADSYEAIFANAETDITDTDKKELISALKALSDGEEIEEHWDMEQVIRYFAAHNLVLNYDSYTGNMLHNYYLYERDGKVTILPWDYNLAFCGLMGGSDPTDAVNYGIDSPLSGVSEDSRPLWKAISDNAGYMEKYHDCLDKLLKNFFENGRCAAEIDRVYSLIKSYVKNDPTSFYTYEEFEEAYSTLKSFCVLRSESIRKQLDGGLSAFSDKQKDSDKIDASGVDITKMGTQGGEKGGKGQMPRPGAK